MLQEKSKFELLCQKDILNILDGDKKYDSLKINDTDSKIIISMPYLSGPDLCNISNKFGLSVTYSWGGVNQSRWMYLDDLLKHCIKINKESDLLEFLFSKSQFEKQLKGNTLEIIDIAYTKIVNRIIDEINKLLYFGGNKLITVEKKFVIHKIGTTVDIIAPAIKTVDRNYINNLSERAMKDITDGNYDSALTKSRTILEEVFCYVIEKKGENPSDKGDIGKLYNQVKTLYNMHQHKDMDKRINGLLSGLEKICSAIADMRNKVSDSHGVGAKRINIKDYHAHLCVNSALAMADFILAVSNNVK